METWTLIWKLVFIASTAIFIGMAVWVTWGGLSDIKELFKELKKNDDSTGDS